MKMMELKEEGFYSVLIDNTSYSKILNINSKNIFIFIVKEKIIRDKQNLKKALSFARKSENNYVVFSEIPVEANKVEEIEIKNIFLESMIIKKDNNKELVKDCINSLLLEDSSEEEILYSYNFDNFVFKCNLIDYILV
jgi:hypothetical protein